MDEVLDTTTAGIEDFLHFVFFLSFIYDRWWRWQDVTRDRILLAWFEQGDVKDRMYLHGRGQLKALRVRRDLVGDNKWTEVLVV